MTPLLWIPVGVGVFYAIGVVVNFLMAKVVFRNKRHPLTGQKIYQGWTWWLLVPGPHIVTVYWDRLP